MLTFTVLFGEEFPTPSTQTIENVLKPLAGIVATYCGSFVHEYAEMPVYAHVHEATPVVASDLDHVMYAVLGQPL
jgi:hypothetical protein